jgi:hypothetical protein
VVPFSLTTIRLFCSSFCSGHANYTFTIVDFGGYGKASDGLFTRSILEKSLEANTLNVPNSKPAPNSEEPLPSVIVSPTPFSTLRPESHWVLPTPFSPQRPETRWVCTKPFSPVRPESLWGLTHTFSLSALRKPLGFSHIVFTTLRKVIVFRLSLSAGYAYFTSEKGNLRLPSLKTELPDL